MVRRPEIQQSTSGAELQLRFRAHHGSPPPHPHRSRQAGTNCEYNGFPFARLSAVIDALSVKGFNRSIEEDILDPLGMTDTALGANDPHKADVVARMAKPYKLDAEWNLVEPATVNPPFGYISAASALISTAMDLAKYDAAIDR